MTTEYIEQTEVEAERSTYVREFHGQEFPFTTRVVRVYRGNPRLGRFVNAKLYTQRCGAKPEITTYETVTDALFAAERFIGAAIQNRWMS